MSAIDEMYEKYGVKKKRECELYDDCPFCLSHSCKDCDVKSKEVYPPFTAEKQLELIKLIIELEDYSLSIYKDEGKYVFELFDDDCAYSVVSSESNDCINSLAFLVSSMTEYLNNSKVKEILER